MVIWTTLHHPVLQCLSHHPSPLPAALLNNHHGCVSFQILIYTHGFLSSLVILIIPSPSSSHHPHHPISLIIPSPSSSHHPHHPIILIIPSSSSSHHPHLSSPVYSCHILTCYSCPDPGHPHLILNCNHPFIMSHLSSHLIPSSSCLFTPLDLPIIHLINLSLSHHSQGLPF